MFSHGIMAIRSTATPVGVRSRHAQSSVIMWLVNSAAHMIGFWAGIPIQAP
jgi:hypothetical protein